MKKKREHFVVHEGIPARLVTSGETVKLPVDADAKADFYAPPAEARPVQCRHCRLIYSSADIYWGHKKDAYTPEGEPLWWCPTEQCEGGGYGFDIRDVKQ